MIIWAVLSVYPTRSRRTHALPYMYLMYLREAEVSLQCPSYSSALAADLGYGVVAHATGTLQRGGDFMWTLWSTV